jgi:adenylate cyclase class IV
MAQELKVRVSDYKNIEDKVKSLGAVFLTEAPYKDTYFNQPEGEVLKLSQNGDEVSLIKLQATDGKFVVTDNQTVSDISKVTDELTTQYGVNDTLVGKRITYTLGHLKLQFNLIGSVGDFFIVTGDNPSKEFITEKIGIKNPEYITVPFNQLPKLA